MEFPLNFYSKKVTVGRKGYACLCYKARGNEVASCFSRVCQCCSKKGVGGVEGRRAAVLPPG